MAARHYSPEFGRFLQPDPSAAEANLYAYTENSPVSRVDPSGLATVGSSLVPNQAELRLCAARPRECVAWSYAGALALTWTVKYQGWTAQHYAPLPRRAAWCR